MGLNWCGILFVTITVYISAITALIVKDSAYHNVVVEIDEGVAVDNCSDVLRNLETTLADTSRHLYTALDGLIYIHSFSIILPHTWPDSCVPESKALDRSRGDPSDIMIIPYHQLFGDQIWTQQSGRCGEAGDQIYAGINSLKRPAVAAKYLLKEWLKYRYGVFDETGYKNDPVYPLCYTFDKTYVTGCSNEKIPDNGFCDCANNSTSNLRDMIDNGINASLMFFTQSLNTPRICNEKTHDRLAPTKHNFLCNRHSVRDVIMKSSDFLYTATTMGGSSSRSKPSFTNPIVNYKRRLLTRYVVVIDETQNTFVRESWSFLRNAIRKWLVYDLHRNTEVGIVLTNDTSADKILGLTSLDVTKNRDVVASFIPYMPSDSSQSACIMCGIRESLLLLANRRKSHGFASEIVLIIAPGMEDQAELKILADWAKTNQTRFVTINFPVLFRREPLDELAHQTGGDAFTVLEQKYNSEKSFLSTYFDLTQILFHISAKYFEGSRYELPIEVHRKILIDKVNDSNSSKRISRVISGNFYLDEGMTTPSGFFIYTHNVEVPLIQNVKLTSPGGITYGTRSDQRIPVKQITIIASVNQTGPWSYRIERFNGNPQPHFVQVLATPTNSALVVKAQAWIRKPVSGGPYIMYCEVKRGGYPVHSAYVEARITRPTLQCNYTDNCVERLKLLDTGSGDPDITKGDGIYSRYFSTALTGEGLYRIDILVDDNGNTAYALPLKPDYSLVEDTTHTCCGSVIADSKAKQIPPFQRYLPPITITVNRSDIDAELRAVVGRIGDLTGKYIGDGKIRLTWTAPDMGGHNVAKYEVRYALNIFDIVNNFDSVASIWTHSSPYPYSIGDTTNFIIDANSELTLFGSAIFLAIRPFSKLTMGAMPGLISNPVRVFIPVPSKPTISPDEGNNHSLSNKDDADSRGFESESTGKSPVSGTNIREYAIAIAMGAFLILVIIAIYLIYCLTQRRRKSAKRSGLCNIDVSHTTIETMPSSDQAVITNGKGGNVSPSHHDDVDHFLNDDQTQLSINHLSDNYKSVQSPDHHIVGLPVCPDRSDYQKDYVGRFTPTLYSTCGTVSVISNNGNTLTRQGRMISPYESWTASQLLHDQDCRVSPIGDLLGQSEHSTTNYDAPPVPPLPFNTDPYQIYSDAASEAPGQQQQQQQQQQPPPCYSTIRRNGGAGSGNQTTNVYNQKMLFTMPDQFHANPHSAEKKRRNVTMV